jgi:hypothetical protein
VACRGLGVPLFINDGFLEIADADRHLRVEMASAVQAIKGSSAWAFNSLSRRMLSVVVKFGNRGVIPRVGECLLVLRHDE